MDRSEMCLLGLSHNSAGKPSYQGNPGGPGLSDTMGPDPVLRVWRLISKDDLCLPKFQRFSDCFEQVFNGNRFTRTETPIVATLLITFSVA